MKKYLAEVLGTFGLTFLVTLSITGMFPVATPILAAIIVGYFVYAIGHVSGAHLNPAVTIGLWSIKKINNTDALLYIIAQFIGAGIAMSLATAFSDTSILVIGDSSMIGLAELIGTFFFTFGIASVVYGKTPGNLSGVVIGGSLLLGITFAAILGSNGVLNPAVAFGVGSFGVMYVLGPILGSVLGMQAYKYIAH